MSDRFCNENLLDTSCDTSAFDPYEWIEDIAWDCRHNGKKTVTRQDVIDWTNDAYGSEDQLIEWLEHYEPEAVKQWYESDNEEDWNKCLDLAAEEARSYLRSL